MLSEISQDDVIGWAFTISIVIFILGGAVKMVWEMFFDRDDTDDLDEPI